MLGLAKIEYYIVLTNRNDNSSWLMTVYTY